MQISQEKARRLSAVMKVVVVVREMFRGLAEAMRNLIVALNGLGQEWRVTVERELRRMRERRLAQPPKLRWQR